MPITDNLYVDDVSVKAVIAKTKAQANQAQAQQTTQTTTQTYSDDVSVESILAEKRARIRLHKESESHTNAEVQQETKEQVNPYIGYEEYYYGKRAERILLNLPSRAESVEPSDSIKIMSFIQSGTQLNPGITSELPKGETNLFLESWFENSPWGVFTPEGPPKVSEHPNKKWQILAGKILGEAGDVALWTLTGFGTGKVIATSTRATNIISKLGGTSKVAQATRGILKGLFIGGEAGKAMIMHAQGYTAPEIAIDIIGDIAAFKGFEYGVKKGAGIETGKRRAFIEVEQKNYTPIVGSGEQSRTTTFKIGVKEVKGKNIKIKGLGIGEARTSSDTSVFVGKFAAVGESEKDITTLKEASRIHGIGASGRFSIFEQGESIVKYSDDATGIAYKATRYIKQGNTITADVVRSAEVVNREKRFLKIFRGFMDVIKPSNGDVTRYAVVGVGGGKTGATAVASTATETTQLGRDILASMRYSGTGLEIPIPSQSSGIGLITLITKASLILHNVKENKNKGFNNIKPKTTIFEESHEEKTREQRLLQVQTQSEKQETRSRSSPIMTYKQSLEQQVLSELKPRQDTESQQEEKPDIYYDPYPTPKPKPEPQIQEDLTIPIQVQVPKHTIGGKEAPMEVPKEVPVTITALVGAVTPKTSTPKVIIPLRPPRRSTSTRVSRVFGSALWKKSGRKNKNKIFSLNLPKPKNPFILPRGGRKNGIF